VWSVIPVASGLRCTVSNMFGSWLCSSGQDLKLLVPGAVSIC
jgi:hypothetical protein